MAKLSLNSQRSQKAAGFQAVKPGLGLLDMQEVNEELLKLIHHAKIMLLRSIRARMGIYGNFSEQRWIILYRTHYKPIT